MTRENFSDVMPREMADVEGFGLGVNREMSPEEEEVRALIEEMERADE